MKEEQEGRHKAEFGEYLIQSLSKRLTKEFGAGFTEQNLRNFRQFYLIFPDEKIRYALRSELTCKGAGRGSLWEKRGNNLPKRSNKRGND